MDYTIISNLKRKLILRSEIIYSSISNIKTLDYYYIVCRRHNGAWKKYNDIQNKVIIVSTSVSYYINEVIYSI